MRVSAFDGDVQRLPAGHTTGWRSMPFLMFSHASEGGERLHRDGVAPLTAATGELFVLPAGVRHKVDVTGRTEVRAWVHVNFLLFNSLDLFSLFDVPVLVRGGAGVQAGRIIRAWVKTDRSARNNPLLRVAGRSETGFRLLRLLAPFCQPRPDAFRRVEQIQIFSQVIRHMHDQFGRRLDRDELADLAGLSPAQFHHTFKRATGSTPGAYLRGIRIRHAQQLLITTSTPVKEIARQSGYDDPFTFSKFFKRECALSPAAYRERTRMR
jgi:AraC-like DNA-binding protein